MRALRLLKIVALEDVSAVVLNLSRVMRALRRLLPFSTYPLQLLFVEFVPSYEGIATLGSGFLSQIPSFNG